MKKANKRTDVSHGNPVVGEKERGRAYGLHRDRIRNMKAAIDTSCPPAQPHLTTFGRDYFWKKKTTTEAAFADLKMIQSIARTMTRPFEVPQSKGPTSLNATYRKQELFRITMDNHKLLNRLENTVGPVYDTKKIVSTYPSHMKNMCNVSHSARKNGAYDELLIKSRSTPDLKRKKLLALPPTVEEGCETYTPKPKRIQPQGAPKNERTLHHSSSTPPTKSHSSKKLEKIKSSSSSHRDLTENKNILPKVNNNTIPISESVMPSSLDLIAEMERSIPQVPENKSIPGVDLHSDTYTLPTDGQNTQALNTAGTILGDLGTIPSSSEGFIAGNPTIDLGFSPSPSQVANEYSPPDSALTGTITLPGQESLPQTAPISETVTKSLQEYDSPPLTAGITDAGLIPPSSAAEYDSYANDVLETRESIESHQYSSDNFDHDDSKNSIRPEDMPVTRESMETDHYSSDNFDHDDSKNSIRPEDMPVTRESMDIDQYSSDNFPQESQPPATRESIDTEGYSNNEDAFEKEALSKDGPEEDAESYGDEFEDDASPPASPHHNDSIDQSKEEPIESYSSVPPADNSDSKIKSDDPSNIVDTAREAESKQEEDGYDDEFDNDSVGRELPVTQDSDARIPDPGSGDTTILDSSNIVTGREDDPVTGREDGEGDVSESIPVGQATGRSYSNEFEDGDNVGVAGDSVPIETTGQSYSNEFEDGGAEGVTGESVPVVETTGQSYSNEFEDAAPPPETGRSYGDHFDDDGEAEEKGDAPPETGRSYGDDFDDDDAAEEKGDAPPETGRSYGDDFDDDTGEKADAPPETGRSYGDDFDNEADEAPPIEQTGRTYSEAFDTGGEADPTPAPLLTETGRTYSNEFDTSGDAAAPPIEQTTEFDGVEEDAIPIPAPTSPKSEDEEYSYAQEDFEEANSEGEA